MPIGRIALDFWTHPKRATLERLTKGKWGTRPPLSMSAGEACARILAWLDGLDDPAGAIRNAEDMAAVAGWQHDPCLLMQALVEAGFVDDVDDGAHPLWHNFGRLNRDAIRKRNRRRADKQGDKQGDGQGDGTPDGRGDGIRGSGSGSGSNSDSTVSDKKERIVRFVSLWNKATTGRNVRRIVKTPANSSDRGKGILRFVDACGGKVNLVAASIDMAMAQEWIEKIPDPLRLDWFLRRKNQDAHIEMGLEALNGQVT